MSLTPAAITGVGFIAVILGVSYLRPPDGDSSLNSVLIAAHLGSFAFSFGIQIWFTFIHGLTLIKLLPRYTFARVQDVFFDKFYFCGAVSNVIAFATFVAKYPYKWEADQLYMGIALIVNGLVYWASILFVKDLVMSSMEKMHEIERTNGLTDEVGKFRDNAYHNNGSYMASKKTFLFYHGISITCNIIAVLASAVQLWYLSRKLHF